MAERLYRVSSIVLKSFKQSATLYITFTHSMHIIDIHTMHICHYTIYYFLYIYISLSVHISLYSLYIYALHLSSRMSVQLYELFHV